MPGGDGTGPFGLGGYCTGGIRGFAGRRFGMGGGMGRGRRGLFGAQVGVMTKDEELKLLEEDAAILEKRLTEIKSRVVELRK